MSREEVNRIALLDCRKRDIEIVIKNGDKIGFRYRELVVSLRKIRDP